MSLPVTSGSRIQNLTVAGRVQLCLNLLESRFADAGQILAMRDNCEKLIDEVRGQRSFTRCCGRCSRWAW